LTGETATDRDDSTSFEMAIQFPCLQKDISFWFPPSQQQQQQQKEDSASERDLLETLKRFLLASDMETSTTSTFGGDDDSNAAVRKQSHWLRSGAGCEEGGSNIMSPVLKETPRSHWLLSKQETDDNDKTVVDEKVRAPDLSTSIWLASTSNEPLTCVTRANKKSSIEWPSILFRDCPDLWLSAKDKKSSTLLDNWLAKNLPKDDNLLDNWLTSAASTDHRRAQVKEDLNAWLLDRPQKRWVEERSLVEKWLCMAAAEEDEMEGEEEDFPMDYLPQDDESSIGVLEEEDDFDIVGRSKDNGFWLL